jgi:hypothetical protein
VTQIDLFSAPERATALRARKTDAPTSQRAAERAASFAASQRADIYAVIVEAGDRGATYHEVARALSVESVKVGRRLKELREPLPLIYADGERDGCQVWKATR